MKFKKGSKRLTCHKKYKIAKKVREHHRKSRKVMKQKEKRKSRNDPGIPNDCPFKEDVLKEAKNRKLKAEEEKKQRKELRQVEIKQKRSLEDVVKDASRRAEEFEQTNEIVSKLAEEREHVKGTLPDNSARSYYKEFKKVVEASDILIEVLDARDPLGCRCTQLEDAVFSQGSNKRLVLLLNKIDLVPKDNVEKWLRYLRNEFPTVAFKACTQTQRDRLSRSDVSVGLASDDLLKSSRCLGAGALMKLLGGFCHQKGSQFSATVGIVGYPNVGKSSVINSLKRIKACAVGPTPGLTKCMQEVTLDKNIKLLDCPGLVLDDDGRSMQVILRNCVKVQSLDDPIAPVEAILKRCSKEKMMMQYSLPDYQDAASFLALLARRIGKLKKGGVPDLQKAAVRVLQDWNSGKISFFTEPPEQHSSHVSSRVSEHWRSEFNMKLLEQEEKDDLDCLLNDFNHLAFTQVVDSEMVS